MAAGIRLELITSALKEASFFQLNYPHHWGRKCNHFQWCVGNSGGKEDSNLYFQLRGLIFFQLNYPSIKPNGWNKARTYITAVKGQCSSN